MLFDQFGKEVRLNYKDVHAIFEREKRGVGAFSSKPFWHNVWVYSSVTLISQALSQIPSGLWRTPSNPQSSKRDNRWTEVISDPVLDLLEKPNDLMDGETFLEAWATYLLTGGNVWIQLSGKQKNGLPEQLFLWGIDRVSPKVNKTTGIFEGWNIRLKDNANPKLISPDEVIHTRLPNPHSNFMGLPPLAAIALQIDADHARTVFDKAFFNNNASPDAVLTYKPGPLGPDQRAQVRESWNEFHQGAEKAGGLAVIGGDYDFKVWGLSHSAVQFIENRSFTREEVASVYKVPVTLLNAVIRNGLTREALTAAERSLYGNAVFPLSNRFKKALNRKIIKKYQPKLFFDFNYDVLPVMSSFLKDKAEVLVMLSRSGASINDSINALDLGWEPQEGGDVGFLPGNFVPLSALAKIDVMSPPVEKPDNRPESQTSDGRSLLISRMRSKLKRQLYNLRSDTLRTKNVFNLNTAKESFARSILPLCAASIQLGLSEARSGKSWYSKLKDLPAEKVDEVFSELQSRASEIQLETEEANDQLLNIVCNSSELLDELQKNLLKSDNIDEDALQLFSSLSSRSRDLAANIVNRCLDAGRDIAAKRGD